MCRLVNTAGLPWFHPKKKRSGIVAGAKGLPSCQNRLTGIVQRRDSFHLVCHGRYRQRSKTAGKFGCKISGKTAATWPLIIAAIEDSCGNHVQLIQQETIPFLPGIYPVENLIVIIRNGSSPCWQDSPALYFAVCRSPLHA